MSSFKAFGIAVALMLVASPALAQHKHVMKMSGPLTASTMEFAKANDKMHKDMAIAYSGNADVDFVKGMIPHHQGAIDMAKIVIKYGKDPEIKKLAEGIITAQESEIAMMKAWLAARPK